MSPDDERLLRRDKYDGDPDADLTHDRERLKRGEPLAYVIGWIPFLGLKINLDTLPLIPRPETEWWTEKLIGHLRSKFGDSPFSLLDVCAGSGAIGLSVLKALPNAHVSFGELVPEHCALIHRNAKENGLDTGRVNVCSSDLFGSLPPGTRYDVIVSNPPYIPDGRTLPPEVAMYEPHMALYAGDDGLALVRRIAREGSAYVKEGGEMWVECDVSHASAVEDIFKEAGARKASLHNDQYGRPRLLVSWW